MKGKNPLFSRRKPYVSASVSYMPSNGEKAKFAKYIANRGDVDPNGMLDIIAHGSYKIIEINGVASTLSIGPRQAAQLIKKQPGFKKAKAIRLFSCSTGSRPDGFAQHLANALGKPVWAPNMAVNAYPSGIYWVGENGKKGEFILYKPGGIKYGKK